MSELKLERFVSPIRKTEFIVQQFQLSWKSLQISLTTLRFPFISMNSTKLDGVLQPTLGGSGG
jgi:hypothetical protein